MFGVLPFHKAKPFDQHRHRVERLPVGTVDGEPVGWYDVIICRGCGQTTWVARDAEPLAATPLDRTTERCHACEKDTVQLHVQPFEHACGRPEKPGELVMGGPMQYGIASAVRALVCTVCSTTRWRVADPAAMKPGYWNDLHDDNGACGHCGSPCGSRLEPVREICSCLSMPKLAVALKKGRVFDMDAKGHFRIRVCRDCGETAWTALGIGSVKDDPDADISLVEAGTQQTTDGPYR